MKTKVLLFVGIMLISLLVVGVVLAQGGLQYSSAYQVQNLEGSEATVAVSYYRQSDGGLQATGTFTIAANSVKTIFPFVAGDNAPTVSSFNGSAVLSSNTKIAVILNTQTATGFSPFYGASTDGFNAGALQLSLPAIACNNSGFNTFFNIQNAGTLDANVVVTYTPGLVGTAGVTEIATIKPGAAKTFDQQVGSSTKNCSQLGNPPGSGKFIGSATVASLNNQPIVGAVMFLGTGSIKTLQGYNAFTSGSSSVNLPLIMANNSSYYTAMQIQNGGVNTTRITVTFGINTFSPFNTPNPEVFDLGPGAAKTLIQNGGISAYSPSNNWTAFGKYAGGASITQSGSEPLVAIVNQNSTVYTMLGSSYEGFDPAGASGTINLPLLAANNSGFYTSIQIQAVSGNPSVTVDYSVNTSNGSLVNPVNDTSSGPMSPGQTLTLIQAGAPGPLTGNNNWGAGGRYIGSAQVTATGGTVVAIVNYNRTGVPTGDTFFTYDGFNATP